MLKKDSPRLLTLFVLTGLAVMAFANQSLAGSGKYTTTDYPYWQVGQYNDALSDACQRHLFNQKKIQNLNIGYKGDSGMGVTGIATREWNLVDPMGLAEPNITYHFFNDGYSNCKVYIARLKRRRN
jgi:hypothetical protein